MLKAGSYQSIVRELYALYNERGFLREEEVLDRITQYGISLVGVNRITDRLIALGVIFSTDSTSIDDDDADYAQTDYDAIYKEVVIKSPGQQMLIDYIKNVRPPQYREWKMLITQMNSGNEYAFNRLFDMYLRVVVRIALRFSMKSKLELDDAIQEGSLGLIRAITQYDSSRHGNLVSYVSLWIQQYINRAEADKSRTIRLPAHINDLLNRILQSKAVLIHRNGREPLHTEIAEEAKTTAEAVRRLLEVV